MKDQVDNYRTAECQQILTKIEQFKLKQNNGEQLTKAEEDLI